MKRTETNRKQPFLKRVGNSFSTLIKEFIQTTSLHGFHWIAESNHGGHGKLFKFLSCFLWLTSVLMGIFVAVYLMILVWSRYAITPTITTIETNNYPISNVPFPAVTICNINIVYKPNTYNIIKILQSNGIKRKAADMFLSNLTALINFRNVTEDNLIYFDILMKAGYTVPKLMLELAHPCEKMLKICAWLGQEVSCKKIFRTSKSALGYCCSFNYQALRNNFEMQTALDQYDQINAPLITTTGAGEDVSLKVIFNVEDFNYVAAKRFFYGAEVVIHDPEEFPEKVHLTSFAQIGSDVSVVVRATVVDSVKDVARLPVQLRFCRFSYEKPLRTTKKYSFQSCLTECKVLNIARICGCIPFYYPLLKYNNTLFRTCGLRDVECLSNHKNTFSSLSSRIMVSNEDEANDENSIFCDCLPNCRERNYATETYISYHMEGVGIPINENQKSVNLSSVIVYFKNPTCIKYRRELFKTWDDFLASFGGIFGLCLGGSVLSLVEIFYFLTLKIYKIFVEEGKIYKIPQIANFNKAHKFVTPFDKNKSNQIAYLP